MNKIWLIGAIEGIGRALAEELGQDADNFLILSARDSNSKICKSKTGFSKRWIN